MAEQRTKEKWKIYADVRANFVNSILVCLEQCGLTQTLIFVIFLKEIDAVTCLTQF